MAISTTGADTVYCRSMGRAQKRFVVRDIGFHGVTRGTTKGVGGRVVVNLLRSEHGNDAHNDTNQHDRDRGTALKSRNSHSFYPRSIYRSE